VVTAHPVGLALVDGRVEPPRQAVGVCADPGLDRVAQNLARLPFVHDGEIFGQADQPGPLAHDVVRQPVQRTHAVAYIEQSEFFDELAYSQREVVNG